MFSIIYGIYRTGTKYPNFVNITKLESKIKSAIDALDIESNEYPKHQQLKAKLTQINDQIHKCVPNIESLQKLINELFQINSNPETQTYFDQPHMFACDINYKPQPKDIYKLIQ